jgi:hypothetical protein
MRWSLYPVAFALFCGGCASKAVDVVPTYVSPIQYVSWSCRQISNEAYRIENRLAYVSGVQDTHARQDAVVAAVPGSVLFMNGNDGQTSDIARLKGELDAAERAFVQRGCGPRHHRIAAAS